MRGSEDTELKRRLKEMIIIECEKEIEAEELADDVMLFSQESGLELDSLDALQISMGLQHQFNVKLPDTKSFRQHVTTINALADFIQPR